MPNTNTNYEVVCFRADGDLDHIMGFTTEREAQVWIATHADRSCEFRLYGRYALAGGSSEFRLISRCGV
jgi:hypothetical protein